MKKWSGAAGVCVDANGKLLMVLQGKPEENKKWAVPSGGREQGESFEACCIREVWEETGYQVEVGEQVHFKQGHYLEIDISFEIQYFAVKVVGGESKLQDPDELIHDIAWKTVDELRELELSFPEDREFLIDYVIRGKG